MNNCFQCKNEYIKSRCNKGNFCSKNCYWNSMKGKPILDGKIAGSRKGHPLSQVSKKIMSLKMKGRKMYLNTINPKIGTMMPLDYISPLLVEDRTQVSERTARKYFSKKVMQRDNFTCRINNHECSGRLETHHILSWNEHENLRYDINNGITLCKFHHPRKRSDEIKMIPTFQEMILTTNNLNKQYENSI